MVRPLTARNNPAWGEAVRGTQTAVRRLRAALGRAEARLHAERVSSVECEGGEEVAAQRAALLRGVEATLAGMPGQVAAALRKGRGPSLDFLFNGTPAGPTIADARHWLQKVVRLASTLDAALAKAEAAPDALQAKAFPDDDLTLLVRDLCGQVYATAHWADQLNAALREPA